MGAHTADVSRNMYDERKRYQQLITQQGKPWVASDDNDGQQILYNLMRRFVQFFWQDGSPDSGFLIVGDGSDNDFIITGGGGTIETAGRLNLAGFQCFLPTNRNYAGIDNLECTPVSTGLTSTILTDTAANFTHGGPDNNLVGRDLVPDITQPGFIYPIVANTQTTVTVTGPIDTNSVLVGAHYRVNLSTPSGAGRTDEVYLDCYLDEISGDEDPVLKHTLAIQIETCRRLQLVQAVVVAEGLATPADYVDTDGHQHYTMKLATLERFDIQDAINPGDITDTRDYSPTFDTPAITDFSRATHTHVDDVSGGAIIPSGTKMLFYQAAAPTGWTQDVSHNDKMLRVVSGAGGGSGGNASPISHDHTTGDHALTISEMPSHAHDVGIHVDAKDDGNETQFPFMHEGGTLSTTSQGGGAVHNHGNTGVFTPYYIDIIVCTRD